MGDVLLLRRAVFALRRAGHDVALLAPEHAASFLSDGGMTAPTAFLPWDAAAFAPLHAAAGPLPDALARRLAACQAALVYSRDEALLARLRGAIPRVVGRDPMPPLGFGHAADWLAGAVEELGIVPQDQLPPLDAPPGLPQDTLPDGFLAIHPGSGSSSKNWPPERFAQLADALAPGSPFALLEGPADAGPAARVRALAPRARTFSGLGARSLKMLVARAGLYVGNDSGVSHLAGALGTATLALFGPTDPSVWAPVGPRVATLRAPGGDLERLAVDAVVGYVCGAWTSRRLISR